MEERYRRHTTRRNEARYADARSYVAIHPRGSCLAVAALGVVSCLAFISAQTNEHGPSERAERHGITYTKDIASIIFKHCVLCHRPGQIGPFSLLTYEAVRARAMQIATVTAARMMPPWKPEAGYGEFLGERRLSEREIQLIQDWVARGAPQGNASDLPAAPKPVEEAWQLGTPDLVVEMSEPFEVRATGEDVFRTFVLPIPIQAAHFVKAMEFNPGNPRAVHHANLTVDRASALRQAVRFNSEPGYIGGMEPNAQYPDGYFLGWTPGQVPRHSPERMAWRLDPSSDLIVQLHIRPTGHQELVRAKAAFYFTDEAPARAPAALRLGSQTIDIPPGDNNYVVSDTYRLPVDVDALGVQPHAHNLAHEIRAYATLPDGRRQWLIYIKDWDFSWQDVYLYRRPLFLPKGTTLTMNFTYDNSEGNPRNTRRPLRRVQWGQNTSDEMGDLWIQVVPRRSDDLSLLIADFGVKARRDELARETKLLDREPLNPLRHRAVALLELENGELAAAVAHLERCLVLDPDSATTHYDLGRALAFQGQHDQAAAHFREALRMDPEHAAAHNGLGALLQLAGKLDEAVGHYNRALELDPANAEAHVNLAQVWLARREERQATEQYRQALAVKPDWPPALAGLAWIHATSSLADLRDPLKAVNLAERAVELTMRSNVQALDALAAAHAAAGRFDLAVDLAQAALDLALKGGATTAATELRARLALYTERRSKNFHH